MMLVAYDQGGPWFQAAKAYIKAEAEGFLREFLLRAPFKRNPFEEPVKEPLFRVYGGCFQG